MLGITFKCHSKHPHANIFVKETWTTQFMLSDTQHMNNFSNFIHKTKVH